MKIEVLSEEAIERHLGKLKSEAEAHLAEVGEIVRLNDFPVDYRYPHVERRLFPLKPLLLGHANVDPLGTYEVARFEQYDFYVTDGQITQIARNLWKRVQ